jgi:hypothetical protein
MVTPDVTRLRMGAQVLATDGPVGELTAIVVDPVAQAATHLIITPPHHPTLGHLVALDLVEDDGKDASRHPPGTGQRGGRLASILAC